MKDKLLYLKYTLFHPFDGFYEIKFREKGSVKLATILVVLYCVLQCVSYQYTGFIMNFNPVFAMDSLSIVLAAVSIPFLFIISNWSVTTLFNGKGNMKDIYIVITYSLTPVILMEFISIIVSNVIIKEEVPILVALKIMVYIWFFFSSFAGLCVIHEYGPIQNIITIVATFFAACIILFLFIMFLSLMEKMLSFFITAGQELFRRI